MNHPKSAESNSNFDHLIDRWIGIEEATLVMVEDYLGKFQNPVFNLLVQTIQEDSARHKKLLELIRNSDARPEVVTPEEMGLLDRFMEKHAGIEEQSIQVAELSLESVRSPLNHLLLHYLLADEKKHDLLMEALGNLRAKYLRAT
ncbi:MAG: hypothetical protein A2600_09815 [Candidatus Lambdaproteobacteria bacterium RIFOXYD1_FULL_56_27]|uniref:Rubrerythrin diiron-binding domain-containing protein n=1 Tax=Candidatus Lambdaproteobacteria bacterium RIFOXYD2_FULL_56_26 TaxID=1817773 RepID=A0A1F6GMD5_9PROT|nr:MAG: hypothetical protein A2557_02030 [Candidatus Lambdaproteobacteria bacterium RIFOXYD2_FULL_56_26]OGH03301.1 MAG: hypothetical protein A2426_07100 [Candidatus Lambdaproteobacteria bacterium RIFOXYC1_FULL_56_13]OGH09608.1 MAG: hypothetical protein A2600_09815 [Candidatus Lambdaproteobacteria bacterium RIFOXYD1_FULL_56_27]